MKLPNCIALINHRTPCKWHCFHYQQMPSVCASLQAPCPHRWSPLRAPLPSTSWVTRVTSRTRWCPASTLRVCMCDSLLPAALPCPAPPFPLLLTSLYLPPCLCHVQLRSWHHGGVGQVVEGTLLFLAWCLLKQD